MDEKIKNNPTEYYSNKVETSDSGGFSFQELLSLIVKKWYWFLISIAVCLGLAILYLKVTPPSYTRKMSVLIKDMDNSSLASEFSTFSTFGPGLRRANVHNEMLTINSPEYVIDVVNKLNLEMNYSVKGGFYDKVLYGKELPIQVKLPDADPSLKAGMSVTLLKDGALELTNFWSNDENFDENSVKKVVKSKLDSFTSTPIGKVVITPSEFYMGQHDMIINVYHNSLDAATLSYANAIKIDLTDDKSTVVDITYSDQSIERAEDVLNTLYQVYNEKFVSQNNEQATKTIEFIEGELSKIEGQLGDVDANISNYKSEHQIPDVQAASQIYLNKAETTSSELLNLKNQLHMAKYIKSQLGGDGTKILPANSGIDNPMVSQQILAYNEKVIQRNNLVSNSSAANPYVQDLDKEISAMRQAIGAALDNVIVTLDGQINSLQGSAARTENKLSSSPTLEKNLLGVTRNQKVMEQQYMFLLQKKEENQLSKAFTTLNSRMLAKPMGKSYPTKPVKMNVFVIAMVLGMLIPIAILFLINSLQTTVRGRSDLDVLTIPFVGEIPLSYKKWKGLLSIFNRHDEVREIVVSEQGSDVINEAFRVVRTNLEFISGREGKNKVMMFTSSNPGSGKTFVSANLATSFAIKGKHVIIIDLDLRKASSSTLVGSPSQGVADYLSERVDDLDRLILKGKISPNLDFLPVGTIPPNPTELLFSSRFEELITKLRGIYDLVVIDCPPVEIVADATIVNKLCDMTVYVIRSGVMERSMLPEVEKYYTDKRFKNMSVILNGTNKENSGYGRYGYTYDVKPNKKSRKRYKRKL